MENYLIANCSSSFLFLKFDCSIFLLHKSSYRHPALVKIPPTAPITFLTAIALLQRISWLNDNLNGDHLASLGNYMDKIFALHGTTT